MSGSTAPDLSDEGWVEVGSLEPTNAVEAWRSIQRYAGIAAGAPARNLSFYVGCPPESQWSQASPADRFYLALDVHADGSRVLVTDNPAVASPLRERPPDPHPGILGPPVVYVGVKVSGGLRQV